MDLSDEIVLDALDALDYMADWEMTTDLWEQVAEILRRIETAFADGDRRALREAAADLELCNPSRVVPIGAKPPTGIPQPLLERRNTLVHRLTPRPSSGDDLERRPPR
jgi:CATRA-associated small protein